MNVQDNVPPVMASEPVSPSPGLLGEHLRSIAHELRELAHDHFELAVLETRLSVDTALRMVIVAVVTAVMIVTAWLALVGSAALALIAIGLAPAFAILLLAAANLLLAFIGWQRIRHQSLSLGWPATQRAIKPPPATEREETVI